MKLLLLQGRNVVASSGGAEKVFCELASGLAARGHEVHAWCADAKEGLPFYPLSPAVDFRNMRGADRGKWRAWWQLRHELRALQPSVVICFSLRDFFNSALAWRQARCVLMLHCEPAFHLRKMTAWKWLLLQWLRPALQRIQVLLPGYETAARRFGVPVVVIPNGTALPVLAAEPERQPVVLCVGRFERSKQQHLLIRAFSRALQVCPGWQLELWGSQQDRDYVEECRRLADSLGIAAHVRFAGTTRDLVPVYQRASLLAMPSRYEGFPLVFLEAETQGLPVLALASCDALAQLVTPGINGVLSSDETAYGNDLTRLMLDADWRAQLSEGALRHVANYGLAHIIQQWEQLLAEVDQ